MAAYRDFEQRVGTLSGVRGSKTQTVLDVIARLPTTFRISEVRARCPGVSPDLIRRVLNGLKSEGLRCKKGGVAAVWRKPETWKPTDGSTLTE